MTRDYFEAAEQYRPQQVRVLFIAESPPAYSSESKKSYFFFEENPTGDILFATIIQAVLGITYRKESSRHKADILRQFQEQGYWLMDAVEYPINKMGGHKSSNVQRMKIITEESARLLKKDFNAAQRESVCGDGNCFD